MTTIEHNGKITTVTMNHSSLATYNMINPFSSDIESMVRVRNEHDSKVIITTDNTREKISIIERSEAGDDEMIFIRKSNDHYTMKCDEYTTNVFRIEDCIVDCVECNYAYDRIEIEDYRGRDSVLCYIKETGEIESESEPSEYQLQALELMKNMKLISS